MRGADRQCLRVREWLSAVRDDEAADDRVLRAHAESCPSCRRWAQAVAALTRRARVGVAAHPDLVAAAVGEQPPTSPPRRLAVGRGLLVVSGMVLVALLVTSVADVAGYFAKAGGHLGWELYAFEAAIGVGFLLAAARPGRYVAGLLPVTVCVVGLTFVSLLRHLELTSAGLLKEASHFALITGLVGLLLLRRSDRGTDPGQADLAATEPGGSGLAA